MLIIAFYTLIACTFVLIVIRQIISVSQFKSTSGDRLVVKKIGWFTYESTVTIQSEDSDLLKNILDNTDINSRQPFSVADQIFGKSIGSDSSEFALSKHKLLVQFAGNGVQLKTLMQGADLIIKKHIENWRLQSSINLYDSVALLNINILSHLFLGFEEVPDHSLKLFKQASKLLIEYTQMTSWEKAYHNLPIANSKSAYAQQVKKLHVAIYDMIGSLLVKNRVNILNSNNYLKNLCLTVGHKNNVSASDVLMDANTKAEALGIMTAFGNISSVVTIAIVLTARSASLKETLSNNLESNDIHVSFFKEILRYYSPVSSIGRYNSKPLHVNGLMIPAGSNYIIDVKSIHHSKSWKDPETFDTNRFFQPAPKAYIPFALGQRSCPCAKFSEKLFLVYMSNLLKLDFSLSNVTDSIVEMTSGMTRTKSDITATVQLLH